MALSSMTGFARSHGTCGAYGFEWEIKSVNAKGFDLRLRLPPGWDAVETAARKAATAALSRGTVYANLVVKRANAAPTIRINEDVLSSVLNVAAVIAARLAAPPPTVDGILAVRGVVEVGENEDSEEERAAAEAAIGAAFDAALGSIADMRCREGATLGLILTARLDELAALAARADAAPGRKAEAIRARLATQIATLVEASERFDPDRLHQEALVMATKADIREELDRIASHIAQARELVAKGGPVGRRLDFLAQELNREVNTCCSKANDLELTNIGLEMKNVVEQFREQVQNLE
ncbi:MAG: YicC family protein [Xanthobacteraceae bacterium]|nr:MAG: YicC family protein [Xanthobacteraceae bacterium]